MRGINHFPRIAELMELRKDNPEEFQLHVKHSSLSRQALRTLKPLREAIKEKNDEKAEELRAQLREHMRGVFRARLQIKRKEIERLRQRVKQSEEELAKLEANSDKVIEQKIAQMEKGRGPSSHDGGDKERRKPTREKERERATPDRPVEKP